MGANTGLQVHTVDLGTFGKNLDKLAEDLQNTLNTYNTTTPDFGQTDATFKEAHDLAGAYTTAQQEYVGSHPASSVSTLISKIRLMSTVAGNFSQRYTTVEQLNTLTADQIKQALNDAMTQALGGAPPTTG